MKLLSISYFLMLNVLLLTRSPLKTLSPGGELQSLAHELLPIAHLICFFGLTLIVFAARWSFSRRSILTVLAFYAIATECLQGLVPGRTTELLDLVQNFSGIGLGLAFCWMLGMARSRIVNFLTKKQPYAGKASTAPVA